MALSSPLPFPKRGLYAITPDEILEEQALLRAVRAAIAGGAAVIQYRCKSPPTRRRIAVALLAECRRGGVPLIINDDVELALEIGADGVHLGRDDIGIAEARARLGIDTIIGVSCYDSVERAANAQRLSATYVAFGRFFPSRTKPQAPCAHLATLNAARSTIRLPIVAIGGITPENGGVLLEAGADLLAVIDAVFGTADPRTAAQRFHPLFADS